MLECGPPTQGFEEVKAAKQEIERLVSEGILSEDQCGLLHGQMKGGWAGGWWAAAADRASFEGGAV